MFVPCISSDEKTVLVPTDVLNKIYCTRSCSELSGLREDIARDFKLLMFRRGKLSTVIYIHTAALLLSVHAVQMRQAVEEERE
jgi:hypothetical protein